MCVLCALGCTAEDLAHPPEDRVLALYAEHSATSDPGEHRGSYEGLPGPGEQLCRVIKRQLIHPFDLGDFEKELGRKWRFEDLEFGDVRSMLGALAERGGPGLRLDRAPQERLVVACWHHALLLTSILRHQRVPVRMRAGFARYIGRDSGLHVGHVVCEVWDEGRGHWTLMDPDREIVDVDRSEFEFASEAWEALRAGLDVTGYRSAHYVGAAAIVHLLTLDMRSVLREELPYWYDPDIVEAASGGIASLSPQQLALLDEVASHMKEVDASLRDLEVLRGSSPALKEIDHSEEMRLQLPD
jgi:hypothetical protein